MAFEVSKYQDINKTIDEYYIDQKTIRSERKIIEYYPRTLLLLITSTYESAIKNRINTFVMHPKASEQRLIEYARDYPKLNEGSDKKIKKKELHEVAYQRLRAKSNSDENGDATPFYDLWGGTIFKEKVKNQFQEIRSNKNETVTSILDQLSTITQIENIENEYTKYDTIKDCINITFEVAEQSFLELKKKRNRVAHNFLTNNFSNTFEEIVVLYYNSMYYAMALEDIFIDMTEE